MCRVNNQGTSEYRINGKVTAQGDYTHVLEGENVLVKARNFLVFQGDVEAIASKSPRDLTRLIEQISGSDELRGEYERLKDAQDRALEASTFAFNKKRSLTNEMKAVQDQKDDALRYEQLVLQRMDLVSEQVMWKLFHVEAAAKTIDASIEQLQTGEMKTAEEEARRTEEEMKEHRREQAKTQKEMLALDRQLRKAQTEADACVPEALEMDEKCRFVAGRVKTLQQNRARQKESAEKHAVDVKVVERELTEMEAALRAFEAASARQSATHQLSPALMAEYGRVKREVAGATGGERLQLDALEHKIAPTLSTMKLKTEKLYELELRRKQLETEQTPLEAKRRELADEMAAVQEERRAAQRELAALQAERTRLQQTETEATESLRATMEKLLQAKIDREESDREVKLRTAVESLKRMFPGVSGRLIDLCQPTHKKYDQAMTVVLGRNLDAVVVDTEQTAIDCIQYMRQQRSGTATFIPLDTIRAPVVADKYRTFVSGARPAIDVIAFDGALAPAFRYACGGALVCDTLDVAKYVCYERRERVKAVVLDGTVIHKSGFLTGGVSIAGGKQRWEEKQVARLKTERDGLLATLADTAKALKRTENDQKLRAVLAEETRAQFLAEELEALNRDGASREAELRHIVAEAIQLTDEIAVLTRSMDKSQREIARLKETLSECEEDAFRDFCSRAELVSIRDFEERRERVLRETSEKSSKYTTLLAKLTNQLVFLRKQHEDAMLRIDETDRLLEEEERGRQALEEERGRLDGRLREKQDKLATLKRRQTELQGTIDDAGERVNQAKKTALRVATDISRIRHEITALECDLEKRLETRNALLKKCRLEEIDLPLARGSLLDVSLEDDSRELSHDAAQGIVVDYTVLGREARGRSDDAFEGTYVDKIRELGMEIERLAPNLRSLDKLESVEARLKTTLESFEAARQDAKRTRDEFLAVKTRRHRLFSAAFKHISEAIDPLYKDLTRSEAVPTGGTAYLSLEDVDEPYNEGIKFHAMPPMKRFLDMEQLSGGEKTVAALALLFALHSFRPAPFFILDEVDAALDNANVQRVAAFIRARAPATQFIVISLKGSLYERAESLIGIYRDPQEISSRVLSLRLSDYPEA